MRNLAQRKIFISCLAGVHFQGRKKDVPRDKVFRASVLDIWKRDGISESYPGSAVKKRENFPRYNSGEKWLGIKKKFKLKCTNSLIENLLLIQSFFFCLFFSLLFIEDER